MLPGSQPLPPYTKDHRVQDTGYEHVDRGTCQDTTSIPTPVCRNLRPGLKRERKELAGRYYQLLSGHAAIGTYLADKIKKI